jgi:hypothetical protein
VCAVAAGRLVASVVHHGQGNVVDQSAFCAIGGGGGRRAGDSERDI